MDGTLAAIFLIAGLTDMGINHCPQGCLARSAAQGRLSLQGGQVLFQDDIIGHELYLSRDLGQRRGPFQPRLGLSLTDQGALWVGYGATWTAAYDGFFVEAALVPGLYVAGDGPDLGGALHFRSSLGAGYVFDNGASIALSVDHRSNGDTQDLNPGLETLGLRVAIPFD